MDIIAIVLIVWLATILVTRHDNDDDDWHGGAGANIVIIPRRCP